MKIKTYQQALEPGSIIDSFEIISVLGAGGFGITYKAIDKDLKHEVAVKEYLPGEYSWRIEDKTVVPKSSEVVEEYEYGLERFLDEGQTLAKFKHSNIVRVVRYLRSNGTGYLVMDYEYGQTLHEYLLVNLAPTEEVLLSMAVAVLRGLSHIHAHGFLHRDVKPGNIYLRDKGEALLIDFGAARHSVGEHSQSMTGIVTAGYAPFEQYSVRAKQGPSCDLYALGATLYRAILGAPPVDAPDRIASLQEGELDPLTPAIELGLDEYSDIFLQTIDWMLEPLSKDRPQSAMEVMKLISPENETDEQPTIAISEPTKVTRRPKPRRKPTIVRYSALLFSMLSFLVIAGVAWVYLSGLGSSDGDGQGKKSKTQFDPVSSKNKIDKIKLNSIAVPEGMGYLSIQSIPSGATIYIDGAHAGETPFTNKLVPIGGHEIKVAKKGRETFYKKIYIAGKNHTKLTPVLDILTAHFTLETIPKNAKIEFSDQPLSYKAGMKLPVGNYKVTISAKNYKTRHMSYPIRWGKTLQGHRFKKKFRIALDHDRVLRKYEFRQYGRISGVRYLPKLNFLLLSVNQRNRLFLVDLAPQLLTTKKDINPFGVQYTSLGKSTTAVDLGPPSKKLPYKLVNNFYTINSNSFVLFDDRKKLMVGTSKGRVIIYDLVARKIVFAFVHNSNKTVSALSISPDEKLMAVKIGTNLYVWDLEQKKQILLGPIEEKAYKILITPDNKSLIVYQWYKPFFDRISLRDNSFKPEVRYIGLDKGVYDFILSEDGRLVYSVGSGNTIKAWNIETGSVMKTFTGHSRAVQNIVLKNGKLYSLSEDKSFRVWDVKTAKQQLNLEGYASSSAGGIDVTSDGTIITGARDGNILFWK
ncbi:Serine/threonine protein kinase [hydrothermal vent metagenome]|uniref:PRKR-like endoplasmic reticulum kinase n=1 Tax=hydrothermal vent metagenome TaxID=652676 RepID=A0A3B0YDY5_9ZZZZ